MARLLVAAAIASPRGALAQDLRLRLAPTLAARTSSPPAIAPEAQVGRAAALRLDRSFDPRPAGGADPGAPEAPPQLQELIVSLRVNGIDHGDQVAYVTPSGRFLLPLAALRQWVRIPAEPPRVRFHGETLVPVDRVPGTRVEFDRASLVLAVAFPVDLFPRQVLRFQSGAHLPVAPSREPSGLLTYTVGASGGNGEASQWYLTGEGDLAWRGWLLRDQLLRLDAGDHATWLRGLTQLVRDDPERLTRFIAGDFFATPTDLTGGAILAGLSYSRSFDLDPYLVKQPTPVLPGFAEVPSDVSVFVGGNRVFEQRVAPGPFEISNLSYITGQRDVRMVVRDAYGRVHTIVYPYYFADQGLAPGLSDFSFQLGAIREDAAVKSAEYGAAAFSASYRAGLSDAVTAGFHAEGTRSLLSAGPSLVLRSDTLGVLSLALLASRDRASGSGHALSAQYSYQGARFAALAGVRVASRAFAFLRGSSTQPLASRDEFASLSYGAERFGTLSFSYRYVKPAFEAATRQSELAYAIPLDTQWSLRAAYRRIAGLPDATGVELAVQYVPRPDLVTSAAYRTGGGSRDASLQAANVLASGEGVGYHVTVDRSSGPGGVSKTFAPGIFYRARPGELQVDATAISSPSGDHGTTASASWGSSIAYVAGRIGVSRPTNDSFAVAQIDPPLAGVRVDLNGQPMGRTDASGKLFLPQLVSYLENRVAIEDRDIPIDYAIDRTTQAIVPQPHAGYLVRFRVARVRAVGGSLRYRRGAASLPLEFAVFHLEAGGKRLDLQTGVGGAFYVENLAPGGYRAEVQIEGRPCHFTLTIPERDEPFVQLPDVQTCEAP